MSRGISLFLLAFGVWSWIIWTTFVGNLWDSDDAWTADGSPTSYFIVHLVLAIVSLVLGTIIGVLGLLGLLAGRRRDHESAKPGQS